MLPDGRIRLAIALLIVVPIGFAAKLAGGPWLRNSGAGVLYEVFWILAVLLVRPRLAPVGVAVMVFLATSLLEFLQLWHPLWLESVRSTFLGRSLVGSHFSWWDFPHYAAGCVAGAALGQVLRRPCSAAEARRDGGCGRLPSGRACKGSPEGGEL